jgi:hypothetical protein
MTTSTADRPQTSTLAAWAGIITGPGAWTLHLWFNYGLEEFLACTPGAGGSQQFLGLDVRWWVGGSNAALAAATLVAGLFALARYRRLRGRDDTPGRRAEWMALCGVMTSVLFFVIIVAGLAPAAILEACRRSP